MASTQRVSVWKGEAATQEISNLLVMNCTRTYSDCCCHWNRSTIFDWLEAVYEIVNYPLIFWSNFLFFFYLSHYIWVCYKSQIHAVKMKTMNILNKVSWKSNDQITEYLSFQSSYLSLALWICKWTNSPEFWSTNQCAKRSGRALESSL